LIASSCNKSATKTGAGTGGAAGTPDEFSASRASYAKHCASCHSENGDGGAVTVDGKKLKVPSLRTGPAMRHPNKEFVDQITKGGDGMPPFVDKLSAADINDMVRFIRKEFQGGNNPPDSPAKTN
jgi:mono/diheme cytochrome c family protein